MGSNQNMINHIKKAIFIMVFAMPLTLLAGSYSGKIVEQNSGEEIFNARVVLVELGESTTTDNSGEFEFPNVPDGTYTLRVEGGGLQKLEKQITVNGNTVESNDIVASIKTYNVDELEVYSSSRRLQKLTEAPSAISLITRSDIEQETSHGQLGKAFEHLPGVDVVQSGMNDFNINTRGFNNSINRRVLVLVDGIDPSTPLLNLMEWNSLWTSLGDIERMEVVRGPGSALYGMNAYNGVINITTTSPKDALGTRVEIGGGEFETFRGNVRHASEIADNLFFKVSAGGSTQRQVWVNSREFGFNGQPIDGGRLEYAGLAPDRPGARPGFDDITPDYTIADMINDNKNAFNIFGSGRLDYYLDENEVLTLEGGGSKYGNEYYVNQTGRILIDEINKPFLRAAYNSDNWSVQSHWIRRESPVTQVVMNAAATSGERSDVYHTEAQWNDIFLEDKLRVIAGASYELQNVNTSVAESLPLLNPDDVRYSFYSVYGQLEYELLENLDFIVANRFDVASGGLFDPQLSPKAAIVWEPIDNQVFRATVNRSFLRPSYPEFFRVSPAGAPIFNLDSVDQAIAAQYGVDALGLSEVTNVWNYGNENIDVESAVSYEIGYKGIINDDLFITTDLYYNVRSNFISNPLPGLVTGIYAPANSYGIAEADTLLKQSLGGDRNYNGLALNPNDGSIDVIVAPGNIARVDEYGVELSANYYLSDELSFRANYSWLGVSVRDQEEGTDENKILPNTSPNRVSIGATYDEKEGDFPWLVGADFRGVQGFRWIAGLIEGVVPEYWVLNMNAAVELTDNIDLGVNVFNVLDRRHYQIFGGTMLGRYATANLVFEF
jgi:outer membrane receptor protein involved in Fe transport